MEMKDVYYVDGVRTWFGKARPDGMYAQTRADDLVIKIIRELRRRNPTVNFDEVDDNIWGTTTQSGDQGTTMGRTTVIAAGLSDKVAGISVDRMCAGGMSAQAIGGAFIQNNSADIVIAGGVEHMGHHPMGADADPNPRLVSEKLVDVKYFSMGMTAERLHDWLVENGYPEVTRSEADLYAYHCAKKYFEALEAGYYNDQTVDMSVFTKSGWKVADRDEQARNDINLESMKDLKTPFKPAGKVTPGNSSGLNDGACVSLLTSADKVREYGLKPKMRMISSAFVGVDPSIMGWGPVPATEKILARNGLTMKDIDFIELNEAFAVQAIAYSRYFGLETPVDPRMNPYGGALATGHPLASSGVRLSIQLAADFDRNPNAKYGLTTMCVGLGMGGAILWENMNGKDI